MSSLLSAFAAETGLSRQDLMRLIRTAPDRYKVFTIPKRSGGKREIAQPARELKALQRIAVERILAKLPVHPCAKAYRLGESIRDNAAPHAGRGPILKMDFADFFPSIRSEDWAAYCRKKALLDEEDIRLTTSIFFRRAKGQHLLKLSIGAPSSPPLSNVLMYEFDEIVFKEAARRRIAYTRYADDLTFSGQRTGMLRDMIGVVEHAVRTISHPRLHVNAKKTTFITAKFRRVVTGVILTNDGLLSLGRDQKRRLSAQVHQASLNKLPAEDAQMLAGYLAFANVIEPEFLRRLKRKYGTEVVRKIQQSVVIQQRNASTEMPD
jgi:hypothetical protein